MSRFSKLCIILLRVAVGWYLLYMGISAMMQPAWSIIPYIQNAGTFNSFYSILNDPAYSVALSYVIKGLLIVSGALIMIGLFVRIASLVACVVMLFFYFPLLRFPSAGDGYYIVNNYLIIALTSLYLYAVRAGEYFGFGSMFKFSRY